MPVHSYLVLAAFTVLGIVMFLVYTIFSKREISLLGTPTIDRFYFYAGKFTIFATWAAFILKAVYPKAGYIHVPLSLSYAAAAILWTGVIIMTASFTSLGDALKVGLPTVPTKLKTGGLYRFSRNPIYVGVFLISIASCLYLPDIVNISFTLFGIYIHILIIREEERFLSARFGEDWERYRQQVNRFL